VTAVARSKQRSDKKQPGAAGREPGATADHHTNGLFARLSATRAVLVAGSAIVALGALAFGLMAGPLRDALHSVGRAPTFVGSETCAVCHHTETAAWRGSHHERAMQHATDRTVLGDFNNASFDHQGVHSRFFCNDGKFLVETDGPDGKLAVFEIKYTFGVEPLQQYLVAFPDGRLQALSIAWDSRAKEQGGQRWFHLYPNEAITHDDVLHWTKLNQNWNFMCAECHSTDVHKNYDAEGDRFATHFSEISVGCEACHGQGSRHVDWARAQQSWLPFGHNQDPHKGLLVRFAERGHVTSPIDPATGNATRNVAPALLRKEVETCGRCHARRATLSEDWVPGRWLSNTHQVSPLARGLYHADGQMLDEVYEYGSFKQSRMFAAGVTCSDCHEPHTASLRVPGNGVCLQCHSSETYAAVTHHHHEGVSPALACASCHMPTHRYMVVDDRHDHSLRIPRPDISARLGTPNACNDCHRDKSADWAAAAIARWHGGDRKGFQRYAEAFQAASTDQADAAALLAAVASGRNTPAFARASALSELGSRLSPSNISLAQGGLADPDPLVRIGALDMLENVPADQLWPAVSPLLTDSVRGVRIRAVSLLAAVPATSLPVAEREKFEHAAAEFVAAQRLNADRPEARSALGNFYARRGLTAEAEAEYRSALRLSPRYTPAAINLADLYRQLGQDRDGESMLRTAIAKSPQDAGLHHALGLALTRLKKSDDARQELQRAVELDPERARYAYVYAVALHSAGRGSEAMSILKANLARHPGDHDTLLGLISFARKTGDPETALEYAQRLAGLVPDNSELATLIDTLRRQVTQPNVR
jgi:predicted CXXCH cytochrome family protein